MQKLKAQFESNLSARLQQKATAHLTEETVLLRAFKYFDLDDSGVVSFAEWAKTVEKIGIVLDPGQAQTLFEIYDRDRSGGLDYREFAAIVFGGLSAAAKAIAAKNSLNASEYQHALGLLVELKQKLARRGARGLLGLFRQFALMDDEDSGRLAFTEFVSALQDYRLDLRDSELSLLFKLGDADTIDYNEFANMLIGEMSEDRRRVVLKAFSTLDPSHSGSVHIEELQQRYSAAKHPEVLAGKKPQEEVLSEFLETFEMHHNTGSRSPLVPHEEFYDYYNCVSAGIENDLYFTTMLVNTWGLTGEPGYTQETVYEIQSPLPKKPRKAHTLAAAALKHIEPVLQRLRRKLAERGARGVIGFARQFRIMDDDNSKTVDFTGFVRACKDFKVELDERDAALLFKATEPDAGGEIYYEELLKMVRGPMNKFRRDLVGQAWAVLDQAGHGLVELHNVKRLFNVSHHPDVVSGTKTADAALADFIDTLELHHTVTDCRRKDSKLGKEEFFEYYSCVSASIENDSYFEIMMKSAWGLNQGNSGEPWAGLMPTGNVDHRKQWLADHHRGQLGDPAPFGTDTSPVEWSTTYRDIREPGDPARLLPAGGSCLSGLGKAVRTESSGMTNEGIMKEIRAKVVGRGLFGFISLLKKLKEYGRTGGCTLTDFTGALQDSRLNVPEDHVGRSFSYLDIDRSGRVTVEEFMTRLRGDLNSFRKQLVKQAFHKLDRSGEGLLRLQYLYNSFDPSSHPDVNMGKYTEDEVLTNFIESFSEFHSVGSHRDSNVTEREFTEYYSLISPTIEDDTYFDVMMKNTWNFETRHRERNFRNL